MKTRDDFKLDLDFSLRDWVEDTLLAESTENKQPPRFTDESLDALMRKVYEHIEKQALEVYHSNEPWALRAWALQNIFRDNVADEAISEVAHNLVSPVIEWQQESYDPVTNFHKKLIADGKPEHSIRVCLLPVIKFVARKGRKRHYSDEEIIDHIHYLRTHGYEKQKTINGKVTYKRLPYKQTTLCSEVTKLQQFFQFLHGRNWGMPVAMPEMPDSEEIYRPMLSDQDIETLIFGCLLDSFPADWIVRLAVSTLYGGRASELGDIESKYIHLDGNNSSIYIKTRKKGQRKAQPIPQTLFPIFAIPIEPMKPWKIQYILKSMCKKVGMELPNRAGWHALRRRVVTDVYSNTTVKEMPIINYFRWSIKQRHLSQLPTYVRTAREDTDREVLAQHPIVKIWEDIVPWLVKLHPEYSTCPRVQQAYNEML